MAAYRDTIRDRIRPHARDDAHVGLTWLADGDAVYNTMIRYHTTLTRTAQEIHDIGLGQIEKLAGEYRVLGQEVLGTDDVPEIFRRLREDPALHHTNGPDIVAASKAALAKATVAMGDWFGVLPKAGCDVEETQSGAIAFYFPPAKDGSRGGVLLHEYLGPGGLGPLSDRGDVVPRGNPGSSPPALDLDRADRHPGVPEALLHRRVWRGWGLYSERLADEMASTRLRSTGWACSRPIRCGPAGSSSIRGCTRSAGAASGPSRT
jgi:hypothetical protein